ncbi:DUF6276 family protein [Natrinema versiforme]|uniref:Small CPxCG-related zinc finger protein n=1 Tax=Natrinema versiforme JCM 10478 TaxID=1227496 RepID=L9Y768_9EURY|nr:DUF6276 family protein [Natrinema versiforme]ELY68778.1 hypothetical protein C489_06743 [Natrinema versiforme JCM 10478]
MACSACGSSAISFAVPEEHRPDTPSGAAVVSFCPHCLTLEPAPDDETPTDDPDFARVSDQFPTQPERAIPLALTIGLCSSLAMNRAAIESLLDAVERAGVDPLLVLDRLSADPSVEPAVDLERRRHQLEQLRY